MKIVSDSDLGYISTSLLPYSVIKTKVDVCTDAHAFRNTCKHTCRFCQTTINVGLHHNCIKIVYVHAVVYKYLLVRVLSSF